MTAEQFCYWLQGCLELGNPDTLSSKQLKMVKEHLNLVFTKVTHTPDEQLGNGDDDTFCAVIGEQDDGVTARPGVSNIWGPAKATNTSPLDGTKPLDVEGKVDVLKSLSPEEWAKINTPEHQEELRQKIRESIKKNRPRDHYPRVHCLGVKYC